MVNAHFWPIRAGHRSAKRVTTWLLLALVLLPPSKITSQQLGEVSRPSPFASVGILIPEDELAITYTKPVMPAQAGIAGMTDVAQEPQVEVELTAPEPPQGGWTVGDPIRLRLTATYPAGFDLALPALPQQWGPFEVLEQSPLPPTSDDQDRMHASRDVIVTLWEPGDYQTPPLAVRYRDPDGELCETNVPAISLSVVSVLDEGETELRDLKPQVSLPGPSLWPWLLGGLALAALIGGSSWWGLRWWQARNRPKPLPSPPPDPRPPHEIAHAELDRIAQLDLPRQGALKAHYSLVADCLRQYVEGRYQVPALDRTTGELLTGLRRAGVEHEPRSRLQEVLQEADLVKFAKFRPPAERAYRALDRARTVVEITRLAPPDEAESASQPPAARSV